MSRALQVRVEALESLENKLFYSKYPLSSQDKLVQHDPLFCIIYKFKLFDIQSTFSGKNFSKRTIFINLIEKYFTTVLRN